MDPLDERLAQAGRHVYDDADLASALSALCDARAEDGRRRRRRRFVSPALTLGAALGLAGAGGVAATQWGPWQTADPDIVITRHWTDVTGADLGTCETRIRAEDLPEDTRSEVRAFFDSIDLDAIEPEPRDVAFHLSLAGRLDEIGRLVEGAEPDDFDIGGDGGPGNGFSDAYVLQGALAQTLAHELFLQVGRTELSSRMETQCSDDPGEGRL